MANVQILALGHALVAGARGEKGGKPSKDSLYGVAEITNGVVKTLVTFGGRRNAEVLKFTSYKINTKEDVMAFYNKKLVRAQGGFNYTDVTDKAAEFLAADKLAKMFQASANAKKVNTRRTAKPAKKAVVAQVAA